ncbi:zinc ABC transporter substrate-binding protein [Roseibium aggregatum]|uniref:High-affinity zinc uptake system protein ZnuA n=1 Tax=Roseibium aggregatum TaxID=187304 RepID=A0A939EG87_9HYPH|nr:zinc ABC transporter substrate-binding protein [Roseibium aggregatum]MBN9671200.1 zinc ABC transporter substrate-binding protein [Roseibium aggregatum]
MRKTMLAAAVSTLALTASARAETPSVAVDIAPVHSLVAKVMEGVGTPDLIVQQGASPHGYSLRPAEAEALEHADIVFWVGEPLEPWLDRSIEALAADARSVELMETEGTTELEFREGATFEKHSHAHGDDHDDHDHDEKHEAHDDHDHDHDEKHGAHDDHGHDHDEKHEAHDDHDHEEGEDHDHAAHDGHDDHDHHGHDPHAWLDPENARVWLDVIAANLSELDPEHAATYAANAAAGKEELAGLIGEIKAELEGAQGKNFIVFHDAYQYFENRFGISATGSIRLGDASDPSPARIAEIRDKVADLKISCVFSEPQFNAGLVETVFEGTDAKIGVLDPLGGNLTVGPDLYPQLIRDLSGSISSCL